MKDLVIIHGLYNPFVKFRKMLKYFNRDYDAWFFSYSKKETIPEIIKRLQVLADELESFDAVVTSFGGIILRNWVAEYSPAKLKRAVMIGTPNQGSVLLRETMKTKTGVALFGKVAMDFLANEDKYLPTEPSFEVGIIAGTKPAWQTTKTVNMFLGDKWHPKNSDGKVKLEETKLSYMSDYIEVADSHDHMVVSREVFHLAKQFLKTGKFKI